MRLNNWLGLLYHTIIVVICGAIIWAMNHFAAEWGFMYNRMGIKIALTALPWILYFIFGGFLAKKKQRSLDFVSGLAVLLIGLIVVIIAFAGHRMELFSMAPGQSMWTLPMDVFLLPAILGLTVWGKGYEILYIVIALVAPTVLFGLRRLLSAGKYRDEDDEDEYDEEADLEEADEEIAENEASEGIELEEEPETKAVPIVMQEPVSTQKTMQWNAEELQKAESELQKPAKEKVTVKGQQLSEEEVNMILAAREETLREEATKETLNGAEESKQKIAEKDEVRRADELESVEAKEMSEKGTTDEEKMKPIVMTATEPKKEMKVTEEVEEAQETQEAQETKMPFIMEGPVRDMTKEEPPAFKTRPIPDFIAKSAEGEAVEVEPSKAETEEGGLFGGRKRRPSGRRMVVQQPEIVEKQQRAEIEWRSHREGSSLHRPDVAKRADESFQSGGSEVHDILFNDDKEVHDE